jgi:hypothetical protein
MPGAGPLEYVLVLAVALIFLLPLYYLMKRSQRRYDQLDRIERRLDDIERRLP